MIVHKFGGTSLGDAARFANVADILVHHHLHGRQPGQTVAVVSAMSQVTSQLVAGARAAAEGRDSAFRQIKADLLSRHLGVVEALLTCSSDRLEISGYLEDRLHELERLYRGIAILGELTARGLDVVSAFGEPLSATILAGVLRQRGLRAQAILGSELLVTDDHFGKATPILEATRQRLQERIQPRVENGVIPVITGYIGATENGITTTLGHGGSDYSAAIIGAGLGAEEVWIWSDVNGILTADPNIVPRAITLSELSYSEAADLAYYGADVLHPKTIRPVAESGIPLRLLNSFNQQDPGTLILQRPNPQRRTLPAIISTKDLSLIAVGSADDSWTLDLAARALNLLNQAGLEVMMFSQSYSEHSLNMVVREQDQAQCLKALRSAFPNGSLSLGLKEKIATISVVDLSGTPAEGGQMGAVSQAFCVLGQRQTRVIAVAQAAGGRSVSFVVPIDQMEDTIRHLHQQLGLESEAG